MTDTERDGMLSVTEVLASFPAAGDLSEPLTTTEIVANLDGPRDEIVEVLDSLAKQGELESKHVGADTIVWWRPTPIESIPDSVTVPRGEYALELDFRSKAMGDTLRGVAADEARDEFKLFIDDDIQVDDKRVQYYSGIGVDAAAYVDMLEDFETVEHVRLLSVSSDTCRVEVELSTKSMGEILETFGGRTKYGHYKRGIHHVVVEVPTDTDLDALLAALKSVYPDIQHHSTRRIISTRHFHSIADEALTDRQFTVLRMAFNGGYFKQPRESTGEELATRLGITKQTFNTHLQKAFQTLFEQLFGDSPQTDTD